MSDDARLEKGTEHTWRDVQRLLNDLKADGYEPTKVVGVPSDARKKKSIYINVERPE